MERGMKIMTGHFLTRTGGALMLALLICGPAVAQSPDQADGDIRAALMKCTADFNARNLGEVCDLFAPDLRYDFQGLPERSYDDICKLLRTSLSDATRRFTYSPPAIEEIIVSGDLAVVRLTWTLKVRSDGAPGDVTSEEIGLDVFRRQPDGRWKIIRYIAFEAP
jgi:ketosteroid isomerase-like protein